MITRIYALSESSLTDSYYGGKILSYAKAYGFDYDFCRFYGYSSENHGGYILINNSNCVIDGDVIPDDELIGFLALSGVYSVEAAADITENNAFISAEKRRRTMFRMTCSGDKFTLSSDMETSPRLENVYRIIKSSFGEIDHDLWYADTSHRIRHGISQVFLYKNCAAASLDHIHGGIGYLSDIAVLPSFRGKGICREMLNIISAYLHEKGAAGQLYAYDEMLPFYRHLDYEELYSDNYILFR